MFNTNQVAAPIKITPDQLVKAGSAFDVSISEADLAWLAGKGRMLSDEDLVDVVTNLSLLVLRTHYYESQDFYARLKEPQAQTPIAQQGFSIEQHEGGLRDNEIITGVALRAFANIDDDYLTAANEEELLRAAILARLAVNELLVTGTNLANEKRTFKILAPEHSHDSSQLLLSIIEDFETRLAGRMLPFSDELEPVACPQYKPSGELERFLGFYQKKAARLRRGGDLQTLTEEMEKGNLGVKLHKILHAEQAFSDMDKMRVAHGLLKPLQDMLVECTKNGLTPDVGQQDLANAITSRIAQIEGFIAPHPHQGMTIISVPLFE